MKKTVLMILCVSFIATLQAQNLAGNPGFENDVTTFTVNENDFNVLRRVNGNWDATTQTAAPASDAISVTAGMWVFKSPNTTLTRGVITSDDKYSGLSALHMFIKAGTTTTNYASWWNSVAQQKYIASLSATKKYKASVWVRKDDTPDNNATAFYFFMGDKTSNKWMSKKIDLTGGTTWTRYEWVFDIPAHMALPANATSTFNWTEAWGGVTLVTTMADGRSTYAGIMVDDYSIEEYIETALPSVNTEVKPITLSNRMLTSSIGGKLQLFSLSGALISSANISAHEAMPVHSGLYVARLVTIDETYTQKLIVE